MQTKILLTALVLLVFGSAGANAALRTETVTYEHNGEVLQGYLAWDDTSEGKRPGVLVVHEWWGLNGYVRGRVEQLAAMGYVAFGLDMYGKDKVTDHPEQASAWSRAVRENVDFWRARAAAGLRELSRHPAVDAGRIAAIGYCFGGATVQQLAYGGAALRGVVSFHGSLVLPTGIDPAGVGSAFLICHGAADPLVKPEHMDAYLEAMKSSAWDWQMIVYSGAKHGFTNPAADKHGMAPLGYDTKADRRSWSHMQMFFEEIFR